jgi:hypothetical protein
MKKYLHYKLLIFVTVAVIVCSCKKFEAGENNEEEVITTMNLYFSPVGGGPSSVYSFDDADGPGGNSPIQSEILLGANKSYTVKLEILNKTTNPPDTITNDIIEEAAAHRFYYTPSGGNPISVTNLDNDDNGVPLGINSTWTTGATATGTITITLRHYPGTPPDKQTADMANSPKSSTDISVTFSTKIQ